MEGGGEQLYEFLTSDQTKQKTCDEIITQAYDWSKPLTLHHHKNLQILDCTLPSLIGNTLLYCQQVIAELSSIWKVDIINYKLPLTLCLYVYSFLFTNLLLILDHTSPGISG